MKLRLMYLLFFVITSLYAQEDAWVYFTDKPDAAYYLANPLEMLSQRALDRRMAQGITLDNKDVPVSNTYITQVTAAPGITVMAKSKWLNALHIRGSVADINALATLPFISYIDFASNGIGNTNRPAEVQQMASVNKFLQAQATYSYGNSSSQVTMLNGHLLHQQDFTGTGKIIAVLDSGFPGVNTTQPFQRLINNNQILGGYDFVNRNPNFFTGHFHGTMVLSTMGGYTEGQLVGTAPDASYYLFITENAASENPVEESLWVEAAEMSDSLGVDIINTSLGYFTYDNPAYSYTYDDLNGNTAFITRGSEAAFSRGIILVTSAGNSGSTANPYINVPGDAPHTVTVGAVDSQEVISPFSSYGPTFDGRVKPDVVAQGVNAVVANPAGEIVTVGGTSFSSPITAGLIACLWQALPDMTNLEMISLVRASADRFTIPDPKYGYGVPDFSLALQNGLGLTETGNTQQLLLYPNPVTDRLNFILPATANSVNISIFNNLGQLVLQQTATQGNSISVQNLANGIYSYRAESGSVTRTGRIVKK
ncbi:S8 family serine peptidase [Flavobacterium sp. J372]|uniref:S8 family serine peptidase n=1 Tax=Flavobacterium sp. J372 TaxID=2898436 RepID=UPI002150AA3A|nr:S8 family serine peptidase [Flavobacterium sp. J372]MCR5862854.1 S8 family serine peptidase [Flavobacterium sp. J372]